MPRRTLRNWLPVVCGLGLTISTAQGQPVVVTTERAEATTASAAASLLQPPGGDPYAPKIDWRTIPPWRKTEFFGIRAQGKVFIYVVDCSGSMADRQRLIRAKAEIRRSVMDLQWPQRFHVIFYNDRPLAMPGGLPRPAELTAKTQMLDWFRLIEPDGETDPRPALSQALALRPDAVFLLSDGEFPEKTAATLAQANPHKVPIHCVDLAGGAAQGGQLKQIARDSGGQYKSRP
jgi:hypothetical protein